MSRVVLDTTVLDEHGEMPFAVGTLLPPVVIQVGIEGVGSSWSKLLAHSLFYIGNEIGETHSIDGVLETLKE